MIKFCYNRHMKLVYGTTNKAKITVMKKSVKHLGIELLSLDDVAIPKLNIEENGSSPLDNAKIKAIAYYNELKIPVFSCDSGLYIDELDDDRQPGLNVRGIGDYMNDDEALTYYSALAEEFGGCVTARYQNAIYLIINDEHQYGYMGEDIASERFYFVSKPHQKRVEGFPLDSISVHIESGKYYYDLDKSEEEYYDSGLIGAGYAAFFQRVLRESGFEPRLPRISEKH